MSKDDVPGEKRTISPGFALACARSTASASEVAISALTAPAQERLMLSAISPIKIVDVTVSFTSDRSGSKLNPLSLPPAIRTTGLLCARNALSIASRLVALESFTFFFSSRRRHTRSLRDWSSDVCSSDLDRARDARDEAFRGLARLRD